MRRVLMIAYYFPPLGGIGSLRALKFATYLPEFDWEPTVVAPRDGAYYRDPTLTFAEERVLRTGSFEMSRFGKQVLLAGGSDTEPATIGRGLRALRRAARRWLYTPDAQVGWYPFALAAGRRALRDRRYDAIFSSSFPVTAHLVGRQLQRDFATPWVAEFRDPASDRLERSLVKEARAVVTVSPNWRDHYVAQGASSAHVITNGFDPADLPSPVPASEFVVAHLGTLYPGSQDLRAVWLALARIRATDPSLRLRLRFIGELPPEVEAEVAGHGLRDTLDVTGFLPHRSALAAMSGSSLLVVSGVTQDRPLYRGALPAKIFEYLGSGLPVLYVGPSDSDASRLVAAHPACRVVVTGDVEAALDAIQTLRCIGRVDRNLGRYTRQALAGELAGVLEAVAT